MRNRNDWLWNLTTLVEKERASEIDQLVCDSVGSQHYHVPKLTRLNDILLLPSIRSQRHPRDLE